MAEKVLRLNQGKYFFFGGGLHLVNPEKPVVVLPDTYVPSEPVIRGIETGVLVDVNQNVLVKEEAKKEAPKKEAPKKEEPKVEEPKEESPVADEAPVEEAPAEEKPKAKTRKK